MNGLQETNEIPEKHLNIDVDFREMDGGIDDPRLSHIFEEHLNFMDANDSSPFFYGTRLWQNQ